MALATRAPPAMASATTAAAAAAAAARRPSKCCREMYRKNTFRVTFVHIFLLHIRLAVFFFVLCQL